MSSRKVKVEKESKEERVAKVGLKQTVIATAVTALLTTVAAISVALINKPANSNAKAEIQYFKANATLTSDDFTKVRNELEKAQEETTKQLAIEKNPEKIKRLKEAESALNRSIEENTKAQKSVERNVERSLEAIESGDRVGAAIYRKVANDEIRQEAQVRQNASLIVEKVGLQITLRSDEVRSIREPKERSEESRGGVERGRRIRDIQLDQAERENRLEGKDSGIRSNIRSVERPERDVEKRDKERDRENILQNPSVERPDKPGRYREVREGKSL